MLVTYYAVIYIPFCENLAKAPIIKKKASNIMVFVPNMIMKKAPNIRVLEPDEIQESLQNTPPHRARY